MLSDHVVYFACKTHLLPHEPHHLSLIFTLPHQLCTQSVGPEQHSVTAPVCTMASMQMMSCSTPTNRASAVQWEVCECGLLNMPNGPRELALVTLLPLCVSRPWPDHVAPVRIVIVLPIGYNYSAFCCSPSSLCLSPSLGLAGS